MKMDDQHESIIPYHYFVVGYKNVQLYFQGKIRGKKSGKSESDDKKELVREINKHLPVLSAC